MKSYFKPIYLLIHFIGEKLSDFHNPGVDPDVFFSRGDH